MSQSDDGAQGFRFREWPAPDADRFDPITGDTLSAECIRTSDREIVIAESIALDVDGLYGAVFEAERLLGIRSCFPRSDLPPARLVSFFLSRMDEHLLAEPWRIIDALRDRALHWAALFRDTTNKRTKVFARDAMRKIEVFILRVRAWARDNDRGAPSVATRLTEFFGAGDLDYQLRRAEVFMAAELAWYFERGLATKARRRRRTNHSRGHGRGAHADLKRTGARARSARRRVRPAASTIRASLDGPAGPEPPPAAPAPRQAGAASFAGSRVARLAGGAS